MITPPHNYPYHTLTPMGSACPTANINPVTIKLSSPDFCQSYQLNPNPKSNSTLVEVDGGGNGWMGLLCFGLMEFFSSVFGAETTTEIAVRIRLGIRKGPVLKTFSKKLSSMYVHCLGCVRGCRYFERANSVFTVLYCRRTAICHQTRPQTGSQPPHFGQRRSAISSSHCDCRIGPDRIRKEHSKGT